MRRTHGRKPSCAVGGPPPDVYRCNMKTPTALRSALRTSSVIIIAAGLGLWAVTGARLGWTQTSTTRLQTDEITGIKYPVRQPGFVAGVEVPFVAIVAAAVLAGASFVPRRLLHANA